MAAQQLGSGMGAAPEDQPTYRRVGGRSSASAPSGGARTPARGSLRSPSALGMPMPRAPKSNDDTAMYSEVSTCYRPLSMLWSSNCAGVAAHLSHFAMCERLVHIQPHPPSGDN